MRKLKLFILFAVAAFAFSCGENKTESSSNTEPSMQEEKSVTGDTVSTNPEKVVATETEAPPATRNIVVVNNTSCDYSYDIFLCSGKTCCVDPSVEDCLYDGSATVLAMSVDSSFSFSRSDYRLCKVVVKELTSGNTCELGRKTCGFNQTCSNPDGCEGKPFGIRVERRKLFIEP